MEVPMKTIRSLSVLSLVSLSLFAGCADADAPAQAVTPLAEDAGAATPLGVEAVLADVETGRDPVATRAAREALEARRASLAKGDRIAVDLALERLVGETDAPRAIALLEDATSLESEDAEKRLFARLAGHEAPSRNRRDRDDVVAESARALARFYPAATPDKKVEIDIVAFGAKDERASDNLGTFAIDGALRERAVEACGLCDEVKTNIHTHSSLSRLWSAIPRYEGRLEKALVVLYVTADTLVPEHYAKWLAAPSAVVSAALAHGQGLVAVEERPGAPPLVTIAAPRAAQLATVETSLAAMHELPKEPVVVKLPAKLSPSEIQSGVRARFGGFKGCYHSLLERRPDAAGKVELAYAIAGTGTISDVVVSLGGTLEDPAHRTCVEHVMASVRYPVWSTDPAAKTTVRYPITLEP
jgi:hypothetical protein